MTLIRPDLSSSSDVDRWMRDFFLGVDPFDSFRSSRSRSSLVADLYEEPDAYHVVLELPGVAKEDVSVELENAVLRVSGKHTDSSDDSERSYEFQRSLAVPENVNGDSVSAALTDGLLHVTLPKREESKPRSISVG